MNRSSFFSFASRSSDRWLTRNTDIARQSHGVPSPAMARATVGVTLRSETTSRRPSLPAISTILGLELMPSSDNSTFDARCVRRHSVRFFPSLSSISSAL
ncbi:MAG: hypothetical protein ACXWLY_03420 [Thermoanaerobaculia bacterium]